MKTLYLELKMGAAGDMLMASLYELLSHSEKESFMQTVNRMGLNNIQVLAASERKNGILGTKMRVLVGGVEESSLTQSGANHSHSSLADIEHIISGLSLPQQVKANALSVYNILADAESQAHGEPVSHIHFHEVGTMDAIADITGVCLLMDMIAPDRVIASPIHVGSGFVQTSHGTLPVPAPATANILKGLPIYGADVDGELCTPTGAALIKHFADEFANLPPMQMDAVGYGMGSRDYARINCVRAILSHTDEDIAGRRVIELTCNMDDMTGEEAAFALEAIMEAGARDAYYEHVVMKKSRPGLKLNVITTADTRDQVVSAIFKHTTTIGVRECIMRRHVLDRYTETSFTDYGKLHKKISTGYGVTREKWDYDDLASIASHEGISLMELKKIIEASAPKS